MHLLYRVGVGAREGAVPGLLDTVLPQQHREAPGTQRRDFKIMTVGRDRAAILISSTTFN